MKSKLAEKLKNRKGFSLTEMLVTVILVVMVFGIVAVGIPIASNAFETVSNDSNAQLLLSIATSSLRREFCNASSVVVTDDGASSGTVTVTYISSDGYSTKLNSTADDGFVVTRYNGFDVSETEAQTYPLATRQASSMVLIVGCESATKLSDGVIQFNNITVHNEEGAELASLACYDVRTADN